MFKNLLGLFLLCGLLLGCQPVADASLPQVTAEVATIMPPTAVAISLPTIQATQQPALPPIPTTIPTSTATATAVASATPTTSPTPTPVGPCNDRLPTDDDLLTVVTQTYGLSKAYEPSDLMPLSDYLPFATTLGYPTELRQIALEPLVQMIAVMTAENLQPQIISGYRSYITQKIAWDKWQEKYPDRVAILSAAPGHSEHQLGTAVDFGSPHLEEFAGPDFEFHTYFYKTAEGVWLAENAHNYGFTLSYPRDASEITGFFYEPWHYRFVGVETAMNLHDMGLSLTAYQLQNEPQPCIP